MRRRERNDYGFAFVDITPEQQQSIRLLCGVLPPLEALARTALADPMVGSTQDRARRVVNDCGAHRAEAVVLCRIPGASHCAREGEVIREWVRTRLGLPSIELEIPPVCDAMLPTLGSRLQALLETARENRKWAGRTTEHK